MFLLPRLRPSGIASSLRYIQPLRSIQHNSAVHDDISSSASQSPSTTSTPFQSKIDAFITSLPLLTTLRQNPSITESRPHLSMPPPLRNTHFVGGAITGSGKVSVAPFMFTSKPETNSRKASVTSVFHIGSQLCGHPGFVHGGLLSVMFDEAFARCVSASFASGLGMTANLNVDFRKPAMPERVYVLRAETVKVEGRKAWVEGKMTYLSAAGKEDEEAVMVAEARALFVEPKFAESMVPLYRS